MLSAGSLAIIAIIIFFIMMNADRSQEWLAKANGFRMVSLVAMWLSLMDLMGSIGSLTGVMEMPIAIVAFLLWANNWRIAKNLMEQAADYWHVVSRNNNGGDVVEQRTTAKEARIETLKQVNYEASPEGKFKGGLLGILVGMVVAYGVAWPTHRFNSSSMNFSYFFDYLMEWHWYIVTPTLTMLFVIVVCFIIGRVVGGKHALIFK